jgi:diadenosine tetraphosphate (Ap4A) HIT family hydrolase
MDCEICPILASRNDNQDVVVFETKRWRVVLDADQRFLGKSFVTLLEHKESISDLSSDDWNELHGVMKRLEDGTKRAFAPSHFNWSCLMNNAVVADQPTHVHWHLHPRYIRPVEFAHETFYDTELTPPKERTKHVVSRDVQLQIAEAMAL